jgi:vacuolar-type H+-ATPase subunit F/Vma7
MPLKRKIHVIGYSEIIILMNLLGIEGTVLEDSNAFMGVFNKLIKEEMISIIIISMDLPANLIDYLIDFKLNHSKPFIYVMPDLFQENPDEKSIFLKQVYKKVNKLII